MIEIRKVKTTKEKKEFLDFPLNLYKDCPYFVPPIYSDEKRIFSPDYFYHQFSDSVFFNAYKDGKIVGRISGIIHKASNDKWKQKRVRFTRFDCIDDLEVAKALFDAVENWGRKRGLEEICGPLGYSDMEREGLLIEGFEEIATFEEQYNYAYYPELIEKLGFKKDVDWTERQIFAPDEISPALVKLVDRIMTKENLHLVNLKSMNEIIKRYGDQFFDLVDESYSKLYGTVNFLPEQRKELISTFRLILSPFYCRFIVDKNDKLVAFGLCFPAIGKALQKSRGHLTLPTIIRILKEVKDPEVLDFGLIGVKDEYRNSGIHGAILLEVMRMLKSGRIKYCETNLNLEDNKAITNNWNRFNNRLHKRRRSYVKKL